MLKNIFLWIVQNLFKRTSETTNKEVDENSKFAKIYQSIDDLNLTSVFSNKLGKPLLDVF